MHSMSSKIIFFCTVCPEILRESGLVECFQTVHREKGVVSKETVVLLRWGSSRPPSRDSKS